MATICSHSGDAPCGGGARRGGLQVYPTLGIGYKKSLRINQLKFFEYQRRLSTAFKLKMETIIVQGGAGNISDDRRKECVEGIKEAVRSGFLKLLEGRSALDAVQASICTMEDNKIFNAGRGSVLTTDKTVEMDAVIMCGKTLDAGAVGCVQNIRNPIVLARKVKDEGTHVLMVGEGANKFAEQEGVEKVQPEYLITREAEERYERRKLQGFGGSKAKRFASSSENDTVGAVAMDKEGNLAYGTSTGGMILKRSGRVGDSPIIGAGGYADNEVGAVSCTGDGESIMKVCLAHQIIAYMRMGLTPDEAAKIAVDHMEKRVNGYGGVIVLNNKGEVGKAFTSNNMSWAWARGNKIHYGTKPGEDNEESFSH